MIAVTNQQAIEVRSLTKSFGNYLALGGVSFGVETGKILAIFGPNGAGKTTLIKVLASIMKPSAGEIYINGYDLKNNSEIIRSHIGVVSHQTFLYSNLTAYENLLFYCRMYDVDNIKKRIHQVVSLVGMQSRLHDRIATMSRGMQQRLSIARCILHKPTIILLDEPETGLDQQAISKLWDTLKNDGVDKRSIIFTSHNLERGLDACDNLIILNKGEIAYQHSSEGLDLVALKKTYQDCTGNGNESIE